jgi:hypothetical protein
MYSRPERIFAVDCEAVSNYMFRYHIPAERLVRCHSADYERYLAFQRSGGIPHPAGRGACVFLDDAMTHHPDFETLRIPSLPEAAYFRTMNRFFDALEERTGLRLVIAAHPRSRYEERPQAFGDRPIVHGKTLELVAGAALVVVHCSTSVNFAVICNRPVVVVKTAEMSNHIIGSFVDAVAASLGTRAYDIDQPGVLDAIPYPWAINSVAYDHYRYSYIMSRDVDDVSIWELMIGELTDENGSSSERAS